MSKNPFKDLNKKIKKGANTIEKGFNKEITKPLKKEVDKITTQVHPLIAQTNQEITKAAQTIEHQTQSFARQADAAIVDTANKATKSIEKTSAQIINPLVKETAPIIDRVGQGFTKAAQTVNNALPQKNNRAQEIAAIFPGPKKATGTKVKTPLIKPVTKKPSVKVTDTQKPLSNISPAEPTIPTTALTESKGISNTTLIVTVAGGALLVGGGAAFFGGPSSLAVWTINTLVGSGIGAIAGGIAAVTTEVMGGSPKVEKWAENVKETGRRYANQIARSKTAQQAKAYLIKAVLKVAKEELKNPKTQKIIKEETAKEVKKELYTKPTEAIKNRAKAFGALANTLYPFKSKSSAKKYKAPKNKEQKSR